MKKLITICILVLMSNVAFSEEGPSSAFHVPVSEIEADESVWLRISVPQDWDVDRIELHARRADKPIAFSTFPFKRDDDGTYVAVVPRRFAQPPGIEYYISTDKAGVATDRFASEAEPHRVIVLGDSRETRREARLARHDGNTSEFVLKTDLSTFGRRRVNTTDGDVDTEGGSDSYWVSEIGYTFRPLSTLYSFGFGLGVLRGQLPKSEADGSPIYTLTEGEPGLNYGYGTATLEFHRNFSLDGKVILGASATGFAAGGGGTVRIGRIAGTRLELDAEWISDIGFEASMLFGWDTVPRFPMALQFVATNRPDPRLSPVGVRVVYHVDWVVGDQLTFGGNVGYTSRSDGLGIGYTWGVQTKFSF